MLGPDDGRQALLRDEGCRASAPPSGGLLGEHAAEFDRLHARALQRLHDARAAAPSTQAKDAQAAAAVIDELEATRRQVQVQLKLELSGSDGETRQAWEQRLQEWSREIASLRSSLESVRSEFLRGELGVRGNAALNGDDGNSAERQSVSRSTNQLLESSRKLEEAKRAALESEEISHGIMSDLAAQRQTIERSRNNMGLVGTELSSAASSLNRMLRHAQQNKLVTMVIAVILLLGISIWITAYAGLPLKWNILVAVALVLVGILGMYLKYRLDRRRAAARDAESAEFHRAPV